MDYSCKYMCQASNSRWTERMSSIHLQNKMYSFGSTQKLCHVRHLIVKFRVCILFRYLGLYRNSCVTATFHFPFFGGVGGLNTKTTQAPPDNVHTCEHGYKIIFAYTQALRVTDCGITRFTAEFDWQFSHQSKRPKPITRVHPFLPLATQKTSVSVWLALPSISAARCVFFRWPRPFPRHSPPLVLTFLPFTVRRNLSHEMERGVPVSWQTYQYPLLLRCYPSHGSVVCFMWRVPEKRDL